jgi:hypothetical protein
VGDGGGAGEGEETAASCGEGGLIGWEAFFFSLVEWMDGDFRSLRFCTFDDPGREMESGGRLPLFVGCLQVSSREFCSVQAGPIYFGFL